MKLDDLLVEKKKPDGTYAGVHFSDDTTKAIQKYCKENKIPNRTRLEKMHTTVLYSRKYLPDYEAAGKLDKPMVGTPTGFDVWESKPTKDNPKPKRCLVLEYDCPELDKRHKKLMKDHDALYDFDEYKTHITFSYDIGDMDIKDLPEFTHKIEIVEEYSQDLDLDWADKSKDK